jgi:transposase-like protein
MTLTTIKCPHCGSENISKNGHNKSGKQVYNCKNLDCKYRNFIENYSYNGCKPEIRRQVLKMAVNGNGTRATGRILGISKDTVTSILKKLKNGFGMSIMNTSNRIRT